MPGRATVGNISLLNMICLPYSYLRLAITRLMFCLMAALFLCSFILVDDNVGLVVASN